MCAPHTRCWWRLCRALLLAAAQACLWGTLSVKQPRRGRCAPRPNEPPIPGQIPCKAGRDFHISQILIKDGLGYTMWSSPDEVIPAGLAFWNSQHGIFQLSVALNQHEEVSHHSAFDIFFWLCTKMTSPGDICSVSVAQTCTASIPMKTYRVFQGAGSRAPQLGEPVCKWGWGWAFCRLSSSCCRTSLQAGTGGAPLTAATGYRQGRWCNPPILRPAGGKIGGCDKQAWSAHRRNVSWKKHYKWAGNWTSVYYHTDGLFL